MRSSFAGVLASACLISMISSEVSAARIDATEGRQYRITKQHGPWMIMVVSLTETPVKRRTTGLSPSEAADQLVYALRRKQIPAYAFRLSEQPGNPLNRSGADGEGLRYRQQRDSICVLAGNYKSPDSTVAQRTLKYIKSLDFNNMHLDWKDNGGVFYATPGQPRPFSGAFLTYNPLFTPQEIEAQKRDTMIRDMNRSGEYSIIKNPGRYTLVVASLKGTSQTQIGNRLSRAQGQAMRPFKISGTLNEAGLRAWKITEMLREGRFNGSQRGTTFEAYCYHDRYVSYVTIGSFDDQNDPRIAHLAQLFKAKQQTGSNGQPFTTGESIIVPGNPPETVIFDPVPRLIAVPQLRY